MFNKEFEQSKPFSWMQGLLALIAYFIGYLLLIPLITGIALLNGLIQEQHVFLLSGVLIFVLLVFIVFIMSSLSSENLFKWQWSKRVQETLRSVLYIYVSLLIINGLLSLVTDLATSENQTTIIAVFLENPVYIIFVAVVFAPIVEEILFRGIVYRGLRSLKFKWFALFMSTFLFGLVHVYDSLFTGRFDDLWFIFVYMAIGYFMTLIYERSGDILAPIFLHMIYNAIAVVTLFFI